MITMTIITDHIVVNPSSNIILSYLDSGPPQSSPSQTYETLILIHGNSFSNAIFKRLIPLCTDFNIRIVAPNRRGFAGSTPFTTSERILFSENSNSASAGSKAQFLELRAVEILHFIDGFIQRSGVPPIGTGGSLSDEPSTNVRRGGIGLVGWSLGSAFSLSAIAHVDSSLVTEDMRNRLGRYLRTHIMLGYFDYDEQTITDGGSSGRSMSAIATATATALSTIVPSPFKIPTIYTFTREEHDEIIILTSDSSIDLSFSRVLKDQLRDAYFKACFDDRIRFMVKGMRNVWEMIGTKSYGLVWPTFWEIEKDDLEAGKGERGKYVRFKVLEGVNHFMHWDEPRMTMQAFREILDASLLAETMNVDITNGVRPAISTVSENHVQTRATGRDVESYEGRETEKGNFKLAFFTAALATVVAATPAPSNTCSTGPVQCCNTLTSAKNPAAAGILKSIGAVVQDVNVGVGLTCSPVAGVGSGSWQVSKSPPKLSVVKITAMTRSCSSAQGFLAPRESLETGVQIVDRAVAHRHRPQPISVDAVRTPPILKPEVAQRKRNLEKKKPESEALFEFRVGPFLFFLRVRSFPLLSIPSTMSATTFSAFPTLDTFLISPFLDGLDITTTFVVTISNWGNVLSLIELPRSVNLEPFNSFLCIPGAEMLLDRFLMVELIIVISATAFACGCAATHFSLKLGTLSSLEDPKVKSLIDAQNFLRLGANLLSFGAIAWYYQANLALSIDKSTFDSDSSSQMFHRVLKFVVTRGILLIAFQVVGAAVFAAQPEYLRWTVYQMMLDKIYWPCENYYLFFARNEKIELRFHRLNSRSNYRGIMPLSGGNPDLLSRPSISSAVPASESGQNTEPNPFMIGGPVSRPTSLGERAQALLPFHVFDAVPGPSSTVETPIASSGSNNQLSTEHNSRPDSTSRGPPPKVNRATRLDRKLTVRSTAQSDIYPPSYRSGSI
ncbi:hypothetical protein D9757_008580 [Collybiopsis confluens]|uniref:AB hydrolase-1 domain-containing protein n=1 Tax=Collybiopsis confluens TaxID=2823264 RepID=A0A8H5HMX3_9AGAR|nr:hypothetical protein D9757_008580 [Collybiopsis confluens]